MENPLLNISHLDVFYGEAQALWDISFYVREGEVFSIVGSNGAGKSTILRTIAGINRTFNGKIEFLGDRVDRNTAEEMVDRGIAYVPEGRGLFSKLTVEENLQLGAFTKRARSTMTETMNWIGEMFPVVNDRKNQLVGKMSGGEQQMVAIGTALMSRPKLLMLDEPSLGLAPLIVKRVFEIINTLNSQGVTILLVEQNIHQALKIASRGLILNNGRITMVGSGEDIISNPQIQKAYMGALI